MLGHPDEPSPTEEQRQGPLVHVHQVGITLLRVLTEIGEQAPGLIWMLLVGPVPAGVGSLGGSPHRFEGTLRCFLPLGQMQPIDGVLK